MKTPLIRAFLIAAALLASPLASGQVTPFKSVDEFRAALGSMPFELEDYEGLDVCNTTIPDGTTLHNVTYNYLGDFGIAAGLIGNRYGQIDLAGLYYDKDGQPGCDVNDFFYPTWGDKVVVTFPEPVVAVGIHFNVGASELLSDYAIVETSVGTATSGGSALFWSPPGSGLFFAGLISETPFTSATIYCRPDAPTGFDLDNLYWVPEAACEPCDANCDGNVDAFDIEPFIDIIFNGAPQCSPCAADADGNGELNAFDIDPFITCLFGP